jgi:hypothetical protein
VTEGIEESGEEQGSSKPRSMVSTGGFASGSVALVDEGGSTFLRHISMLSAFES